MSISRRKFFSFLAAAPVVAAVVVSGRDADAEVMKRIFEAAKIPNDVDLVVNDALRVAEDWRRTGVYPLVGDHRAYTYYVVGGPPVFDRSSGCC